MRRPFPARPAGFSLRRRLVWQFVALSALLVVVLFFAVRLAAERASRASQDAVLGAAVIAVADGIRPVEDGLSADLPYAAFSMLGAMGNERIFYSLSIGPRLVSGYENLPPPPQPPGDLSPVFYNADYNDSRLRLASVTRRVTTPASVSMVAAAVPLMSRGTTGPIRSSFSVLMTADSGVSGTAPPV